MASRTRWQMRMRARDEEDEEKQPAVQPSAHVSPAMRIYRHALECVLGMLKLEDLIQILAVSRSWAAAVRSMKPIHASIERHQQRSRIEGKVFRPLPPVCRLANSSLMRHIAVIEISHSAADFSWTRLNTASLGLLARYARNLTSLWCTLTLTSRVPLVLPAKLRSLQLQIDDYPVAVNRVLTALAGLPSLSRLLLGLSAFEFSAESPAVQLSLLAACPSLSDLKLESFERHSPKFSDAQVKQICSSLGHMSRLHAGCMKNDDLARFLLAPVTARWQVIGSVQADALTGELLLRLPTLTKLNLSYSDATATVAFLPQLSQLRVLHLDCDRYGRWSIPADDVLVSLVLCKGLTELSLTCGFNSAHWSALFAELTIKKLKIWRGELENLQCFAVGPITQSLEELALDGVSVPLSDLSHLYALRRLRTLELLRCFSSPSRLDEATLTSLSPPTALFPALTSLTHWWPTGDYGFDEFERQGPSFEWMQARLTQ